MSLKQGGYIILFIFLTLTYFIQTREIKKLKARIEQLIKAQNPDASQDERLAYLREELAHLEQVQAVKALRKRYPELSLLEANELWKRK